MKIDRVRAIRVSAEWDYHEPLDEAHLSRPVSIYPKIESPCPHFPLDPAGGRGTNHA